MERPYLHDDQASQWDEFSREDESGRLISRTFFCFIYLFIYLPNDRQFPAKGSFQRHSTKEEVTPEFGRHSGP